MSGKQLVFEILSDGAGKRTASLKEGKIEYGGALYDELFFDAETLSTMFAEASFVLHDVTIGVGFHWERKETQKFAGALKVIVDKGTLTATKGCLPMRYQIINVQIVLPDRVICDHKMNVSTVILAGEVC